VNRLSHKAKPEPAAELQSRSDSISSERSSYYRRAVTNHEISSSRTSSTLDAHHDDLVEVDFGNTAVATSPASHMRSRSDSVVSSDHSDANR